MKTIQEKITNKLEPLLIRSYDAEKGFKKAAENTQNQALKKYFKTKAKQRNQFSMELIDEIKQLGGDFYKSGSLEGSVHRAWMDLKIYFTDDNAEAMLEESILGEKKAIEDYKEVIYDTTIPPSIKSILEAQVHQIENGLSTIKNLENIY